MLITHFDESELKQIKTGEDTKIAFKDISTEDLIKCLDYIYEYENTFEYSKAESRLPNIVVDIKRLSIEAKAEALKYSMSRLDLVNASMIMNIFAVAQGVSSLSPEYFANEEVYFNSIVEMVKVKSAITEEIRVFCTTLSKWLLSAISSSSITEYSVIDEPQKLPKVFEAIFLSYDLIALSNFINNSDTISTDDLYLVENAFCYVSEMCAKTLAGVTLLNNFLSSTDKVIDDAIV